MNDIMKAINISMELG